MFLRSLAHFHSDTLHGRLHDVCLLLIHEVSTKTGLDNSTVDLNMIRDGLQFQNPASISADVLIDDVLR